MSHEIAETNGLIKEIHRLRGLLALAEADAAALRQAIWSARFDIHYRHKDYWTWEECPKPTCYPLREALAAEHGGAALLSELAELRAENARLRMMIMRALTYLPGRGEAAEELLSRSVEE